MAQFAIQNAKTVDDALQKYKEETKRKRDREDALTRMVLKEIVVAAGLRLDVDKLYEQAEKQLSVAEKLMER